MKSTLTAVLRQISTCKFILFFILIAFVGCSLPSGAEKAVKDSIEKSTANSVRWNNFISIGKSKDGVLELFAIDFAKGNNREKRIAAVVRKDRKYYARTFPADDWGIDPFTVAEQPVFKEEVHKIIEELRNDDSAIQSILLSPEN